MSEKSAIEQGAIEAIESALKHGPCTGAEAREALSVFRVMLERQFVLVSDLRLIAPRAPMIFEAIQQQFGKYLHELEAIASQGALETEELVRMINFSSGRMRLSMINQGMEP